RVPPRAHRLHRTAQRVTPALAGRALLYKSALRCEEFAQRFRAGAGDVFDRVADDGEFAGGDAEVGTDPTVDEIVAGLVLSPRAGFLFGFRVVADRPS